MAHPRRFRFGVQLNQAFDGCSWTESVRELEALGYSTLFVPDHVDSGMGPLTAMAAAVTATTTLKVAPLVLDCDFRHPGIVSRELATIDLLSEGRIEVGLGAGWKRVDYTQTGIPMDRPGIRVDRMIEHAKVLRALWSGAPVDFSGEHYEITGLVGSPAPHTPGGPPVIIGGGAPRVLRFAGEFADIVGVNPSIHSGEIDTDAARDAQADRIDQKLEWVREGAGDRFDDLELQVRIHLAMVTDDRVGLAEQLAPALGLSPEAGLASPHSLAGTVEQIVDDLVEQRERFGISSIGLSMSAMDEMAPVVARLAGT